MKIAILGEKKSVLPFRALGADVFCVKSERDMESIKTEMENGDFALVFIAEEIARKYQKHLEPLYERTMPALVVIPGAYGSWGRGAEDLTKSLARALGSSKFVA